ncbi:MAG: BMP family ABC transporter substrate-binding protein [Coriobacteriales bacterium]|nr:BMP family ABC transporter substrate-binding protein [Coriobacteriales bacterium]
MGKVQLTRRTLLIGAGMGALSLVGCGKGGATDGGANGTRKVVMVTNVGGINDQGFCELSWKGLQRLRDELGYDVSYIESRLDSDYATNIDKAIDYGADFVWAIGFAMYDAVSFAAKINPDLDVKFGIVDAGTSGSSNLTGVLFAAQEPSFVVGYIAGRTTQTDQVGFVGGIESDNIYAFEYGYLGGVAYAAHELGKHIEVPRQYAQSFTDNAKGKSIAQKMFAKGVDVVYHAAGSTGVGVIEAAQEANKFAIGVDMDQSYLAPNNVLTSAIKRVDTALFDLTPQLIDGKIAGGQDLVLTLAEGEYMGIAEEHSLMDPQVYEDALALIDRIKEGDVVAPASNEEYEKFVSGLGMA